MQNRLDIVEEIFLNSLAKNTLPQIDADFLLSNKWNHQDLVDLFESQLLSRLLDQQSRVLKNTGNSFYTIGSSGHEANCAYGKIFNYDDMAFLHYRSCAFFIQRAKQLPGMTPLYDTLLSYCASKEDPISGGRHKVFGSKPLFIPPQTSTIASHLPKAVGAAYSIGLSQKVQHQTTLPKKSVILCSFGVK